INEEEFDGSIPVVVEGDGTGDGAADGVERPAEIAGVVFDHDNRTETRRLDEIRFGRAQGQPQIAKGDARADLDVFDAAIVEGEVAGLRAANLRPAGVEGGAAGKLQGGARRPEIGKPRGAAYAAVDVKAKIAVVGELVEVQAPAVVGPFAVDNPVGFMGIAE